MEQKTFREFTAEAFGTFVLTFLGCSSVAIAGTTLGTLGISLAFGLCIVAMAFVIGGVSGCHINPAVSLGLFLDKRLSGKELIGYWVSQFIGGIVGAALLLVIVLMTNVPTGADLALGTNGFGEASSVEISMIGALIVEIVLTCIFVLVVLGSTSNEKITPFAGLFIGLTLTLVNIIGIPLTGASVNPARSFGPALMTFIGNGDVGALSQVWVFIVAPLVGAALAALVWKAFKPASAPVK